MNARIPVQKKSTSSSTPSFAPVQLGLLQRKCACGGKPGFDGECAECRKKRSGIQTKLKINRPGDKYEQEADQIAEQVMRMPASIEVNSNFVYEVIRSPGKPLDPATRTFMESRLGYDFSDVRVHTDSRAAKSARFLNAKAYTVGHHIAFGSGQYTLQTGTGKRLLAHELVHVKQQGNSSVNQGSSFEVSHPEDSLEKEAQKVADRAMRYDNTGNHIRPVMSSSGHSLIQRVNGGEGLVCEAPETEMEGTQICEAPTGEELICALPEPEAVPDTEGLKCVPAELEEEEGLEGISEEELAHAGLIALGTQLQTVAAPEAEFLRGIYHKGMEAIHARRAQMIAAGASKEAIARTVSRMRFELAMEVRETGSTLMKKAAEAYDRLRGNQGRPTYNTLKARGKTDAQIIKSATRSDDFINRMPRGLRWTGRALWVVTGGISVYVVLSAPEEERGAVLQQEIEGVVGTAAGTALGAKFCIVFGVATKGLGLILCGVLGGIAGGAAAREFNLLQLLGIAPHNVPTLAGRMYRVSGDWDVTDLLIVAIVHRRVADSEHVLVIATGRLSGERISGRGHYRALEVVPANQAAVDLFGGIEPKWVPRYLLHTPTREDLMAE